MSEVQYDDALLVTSENLNAINWDTIETGGKLSVANTPHLCLVKKVGGYLHNFETYTAQRAKIQLQVIDGPDKGKTQYDDISLPNPQESDGTRNRRLLIGSRMGLIPKGSKEVTKVNWKMLEGRQVLITIEDTVSKKNGKVYANVTFDGWQDPAAAPVATGAAQAGTEAGAQDQYGDI